MPYRIDIYNFQKSIPIEIEETRAVVLKALKFLKILSAELSVAIVTDRKIHVLNRQYLAHDHPTDVVTFDLSGERTPFGKKKQKFLDGEIIVSATTAFRMSKELRIQPMAELVLYIVHGILHLTGFDDKTLPARKEMRIQERDVLEALGFSVKAEHN